MPLFFKNRNKYESLVIDLSPTEMDSDGKTESKTEMKKAVKTVRPLVTRKAENNNPTLNPNINNNPTLNPNIESKNKSGLYKSQVKSHIRAQQDVSSSPTIEADPSPQTVKAKTKQPDHNSRKADYKRDQIVKALVVRLKRKEASFTELEQKYFEALEKLQSLQKEQLAQETVLKPMATE